jgi:hypothetical protein
LFMSAPFPLVMFTQPDWHCPERFSEAHRARIAADSKRFIGPLNARASGATMIPR